MMRPILKISYHTSVAIIEVLVVLAFIFLGLMCFGFWRLSQGPVDVTFAAETVKKAIVSPDHKTDLQFDSIVAEWREFTGPISIGLSGVRLIEHGKPVMNIPQLGIRIAKTPLLIGMIKPEAVIIRSATFKLYRAKNGGIHLFLNDTQGNIDAKHDSAAKSGFKELGEAFFKGGTLPDYHQIEPLSQMERLSVEDTHLIIIDEETGKGWNIPDLNFEAQRKDNEFKILAHYREGKDNSANFSFLLQRDIHKNTIRFYSDIDKINASTLGGLFLPVESARGPQFIVKGKVEGRLDKDWNVLQLDGDLSSNEGEFNLGGMIDVPLKFSRLSANISYDKSNHKIILHDTHVDINNRTIDLGGEKLAGDLSTLFFLNIKIPDITFDDLQLIWPEEKRGSIVADWLTKRLSKGKVQDLKIIMPIDMAKPDTIDTTLLDASLSYDGLTADYQFPMIPATNARGTATLKNDILTILIDDGKLGDMNVQKGKVEITNLTHPEKVGLVTINADVMGNISSALEYIARDPISLGERVGIKPSNVRGTTSINALVTFPALLDFSKDQIGVDVSAKMNNVLIPSIVRGMDLTGGPYDLTVGKGVVNIAGKGSLGGQQIALTYTESIDRPGTIITAEVNADKKMRDTFGVHIDDFVEGGVPVRLDYKQDNKAEALVAISADLTPAVVKLSAFKYRKREGKSGTLTCNAYLQNNEVRQIKDLKINIDKEGSASGSIGFGKANEVRSGHFGLFTLAGANNFTLDFVKTSPNVFDVIIKGKQLDGRPFLGSYKGTGVLSSSVSRDNGVKVSATVNVAQIKTGDAVGQMLTSPNLSLRTNTRGDITFLDLKGEFQGGNLSATLKPDGQGKSQLRILSDNAGEALRVMNIYDSMIGGKMDIRGQQVSGGDVNDIVGRGMITNFTIVKAPVLAKFINLFSLSGLTELLQNKGIGFKSLKTDFEWKQTKAGRIIALKDGRTTGASIGLTFGGNINQDKGEIDLSGTFVPMSEINGFFSKIPLIGNLLTGGKNGGLIAATYSMKGDSKSPTVLLNPLSVLTPGFLRSILFENDKNVFDDPDESKQKQPAKKRAVNN